MENLPPDLPEKVASPSPDAATDQPRMVRPSSARIWFMLIMFFFPLLIMLIFGVFLITSGLLAR